ncbi:DUF5790 family protein [Haloferacaceae archaeon DSL9]
MSQSTFSDDELFGEAAAEIRADVERHLADAKRELPTADDVWETDAENVLGVLNGLRSALDVGEAETHLRQAKKWYTIGERADAFDDAEDLRDAIDSVEELLETVTDAKEEVAGLTSTVPALRGSLEEAHEEADAAESAGAEDEAADEAADDEDEESADAEDESDESDESDEDDD